MRCVTEAKNLKGKKILLRLDLNMPVKNGVVTNSFRLEQSLDTINFLRNSGAKIIIISHFESKEGDSMRVVIPEIEKYTKVKFCEDIFSEESEKDVDNMQEGDVILFENTRKWSGEKDNDQDFVKKLASYADIYVNDAFSASHRSHASIVGVPKILESYCGIRFKKEVDELSKVFKPNHPFVFVLGGAKFETKIPLIEKFLNTTDQIIIGGALANDIYKSRGCEVGKSLISQVDISKYANQSKIMSPNIVVVENKETKSVENISAEDKILDADPQGLTSFEKAIDEAKMIVWNGPLGDYEHGFTEGTEALARMISNSGAFSVIGGGDTLAAIEGLGISEKIGFISTGGGAMLDFLANETLVGIEALS